MHHVRKIAVAVGLVLAGFGSAATAVVFAAPAHADHCTTTTSAGPDGILGNADDVTTTTCNEFDAGAQGKHVFDGNWNTVLTMVKEFAPYAIGGALVLLAIRKVVRALSGARSVRV